MSNRKDYPTTKIRCEKVRKHNGGKLRSNIQLGFNAAGGISWFIVCLKICHAVQGGTGVLKILLPSGKYGENRPTQICS